MKKILALIMAVLLCLSVFALAGCKKSESGNNDDILTGPERYKEKYGFEAHVEKDSEIIGKWTQELSVDSIAKKTVWRFDETATLYVVENLKENDVKVTTDGAYDYNEETKEISFILITSKKGDDGKMVADTLTKKAQVSFDGNKMTFTYEDGTIDVFTK